MDGMSSTDRTDRVWFWCVSATKSSDGMWLLDCPQLAATRLKYFCVATLKDLFEQVDLTKIIDYCKDIQLYNYQ